LAKQLSKKNSASFRLTGQVTGHFAYETFRLLDTSPTGHFAYWPVRLMDSSPTRHFAYDRDISPTRHFAANHTTRQA